MATHAQLQANRRNAQKSTGPRTEAGKHRSSKNAVRHGLLASIVPAETEGWKELLLGLYDSLRPQDELQRFLVDQIAHSILRLQRSAAFEQRWLGTSRPVAMPQGRQYIGEEPPTVSPAARIAEFVMTPSLPTFLRYEAACNRQIHKNLQRLQTLQSAAPADKPDCPYLTEQVEIEQVEVEEKDASSTASPNAPQHSLSRPGNSQSEQPGGLPSELPGDGLPLTEWERQMQETREWLAELGFVSQ
jgi:hypothetical protein